MYFWRYIMKKIISYMERKIPFYFTAMLVPMLLFGVICVFIEITPFGDHSFLIADMEKQYLDFFSYYQSIFQGKSGQVNFGKIRFKP